MSAILGDEVRAENDKLSSPGSENSQTMALLQANVSSASVFEGKNAKKEEKETEGGSENLNIVSDNALLPVVGPVGFLSGGIGSGDIAFDDISVYVVRSGDTISQVADMFGVSVDTVLSANDMKKGEKLKIGSVLLILPFSGIEHTVVKGQTLQGIANAYKVDINEILLANDVELDSKLVIGEKLMIPGAGMLAETKPRSSSSSIGRSSMPSILGYFANPLPSGRKSRGLTGSHRGVDIAAPTGTPIYASAAGQVLTAKMGWNGAYGNMVILQHPNGTRTLYAHMSRLGTKTGSSVVQGAVIGYVGSTGRSTGPHLHFEVLGAKNPF
ncbi:peptidoglycan DD-metalloendopeptidase family protein [Candidatus Nomurabacteria bacterium]|nr:peptidoglycan DD-metalloendopeptidase family protein [Candidatus Nomurabacteria bacterium]